MNEFGFIKVAAATPKIKVADPQYNITQIEKLISAANAKGAVVLVFPELCITGYTCGDLFGQKLLLDKSLDCLGQLLKNTKDTRLTALVGLPVIIADRLYNCAAVIQQGRILGLVPKMYLPNYKEFYEKRWFTSGFNLSAKISEVTILGQIVPFGNLLFKDAELGYVLGVEICEDLWSVVPPSSYLALNGANIIANLSASNDIVSKSDYRRQLVSQQSARSICGYVYSSAGVHESTTDVVFGGDCMVAENGSILKTAQRFNRDNSIIYADVDIARVTSERLGNKSFSDNYEMESGHRKYRTIDIHYDKPYDLYDVTFDRVIPAHPFIPNEQRARDERCQEIFNIQVAGLAKRLEHTNSKTVVIGISGGLDSTLALLVSAKAFELLDYPSSNIYAITMPGFGTTDITYSNAVQLMQSMRVNFNEIDIKPACIQHFMDIGHDVIFLNSTYENTQARERTQILMDMANRVNGLVIGTGDLSELALGWSTYNGDHMSMYAVNSGVPKTLVRFLVQWVADNAVEEKIREVLYSILDTPISPELLPPDPSGNIQQKTEDTIGPYELHDFFLYYAIRFGMPPQKVAFLARQSFADKYSIAEIKKWLRVFYKRFFTQQFKRSCLPDGPKVGTISLSPRGDWRMPSDAEVALWLEELE